MTACDTSSFGATSCRRAAVAASVWTRSLARSGFSGRVSAGVKRRYHKPAMKPVGKPDAGNPHVRFDERGGETGLAQWLATAPFLDSTCRWVEPRKGLHS